MTLYDPIRLDDLLVRADVDVLVAARPDNVRYLVDLPSDLPAALDLRVAVIARTHPFAATTLVAPRAMAGSIPAAVATAVDVWLYGEFHALLTEPSDLDRHERLAAELLATASGEGMTFDSVLGGLIQGISRSLRLAWDDDSIAVIAETDGRKATADGQAILRKARLVKTGPEIERMQRAARAAEMVEETLFDGLAAGKDWLGVATTVPGEVSAQGARFGFFTGGAGWQGGFMFAPESMPLSPGQLVRLDLGLTVDGYWSDTGRSASIGEPDSEAATRYEALRAGADAALTAIRPGVTFAALYEAAISVIRETIPAYRRHHCGHAIGLRAYDGPIVAPLDNTILEEGMVLNVEVPLYVIGWGGLQLEDTVVVQSDGFLSLTRMDRGLRVIPV